MGSTRAAATLSALLACTTAHPERVEDCPALSDPAQVEECRYTLVRPLIDDADALDTALDKIEDPGSRDLLLLRLAITAPTKAASLCLKVTTQGAEEKCRQVLGRPHLQTTRRPPR